MKFDGKELQTIAVFPAMMTVPDCVVVRSNKIGTGNGEAKLYVSSKDSMYEFYGNEGFVVNCFMLKKDLISYMYAIKNEYFNPSQEYAKQTEMPTLWNERMEKIMNLEEVIEFKIADQNQIQGPRGYVKSSDEAYQILREIALPLVSYIYVEKVGDEKRPLFYWKLFVDFDAIWEKQNGPLVFRYGHKPENRIEAYAQAVTEAPEQKKQQEIRKAREGQGKYREQLLEQCRFCPITMISDERLLIASHIKPWAASEDNEKIDPYNGYMLSPMFDKLFDKGFITFTESRHVILSDFISPFTWKQIGIKNDTFIKALPMDDKRIQYLDFHHQSVFKGSYDASLQKLNS